MKKLLSLVLAVIMVLGLTTVAFAAPEAKYLNEANYEITLKSTSTDFDGSAPGTEIDYWIKFKDADVAGSTFEYIKKGSKEAKLSVSLKKSSGAAAIDSASIKYDSNNCYVRLTLADPFVSTKEVDWKAVLTFSYDNRKIKNLVQLEQEVFGSILNDVETVDSDSDIVYADETPVIEADEYNKNLEVALNDDISFFARVFAGKKYYAYLNEEPDDAAVAIMDKYLSIVNYAEFKQIGFSSADVAFNYSDNMYAYTTNSDGALVYVGRTNDTLPYNDRYYISSSELDILEDVEEPELTDGEVDDTETADGGGDVVAPSPDNNYNPGTGR